MCHCGGELVLWEYVGFQDGVLFTLMYYKCVECESVCDPYVVFSTRNTH